MTKSTNNVFRLFPNQPSAIDYDNEGQDQETLEREAEIREDTQINVISMMAINRAMHALADIGFDTIDPKKELNLLTEMMFAYVAKLHGKPHPLQELAEVSISVDENDTYTFHQPKMMVFRETGWSADWDEAPKSRQILMKYDGTISNVYWDGVIPNGFDEPIGWVFGLDDFADIDIDELIKQGAKWAEIPA